MGKALRENACSITGPISLSKLNHQHLGFKKGMAIASLNVNGLRGHFDEIQVLLRDLGIHILATDLWLPKKRTSNGQKCFSFRGAKLWNGLTAESKQASSLNSWHGKRD